MSNAAEFAKYSADLNTAASRAARLLRDAHQEEYYFHLKAEMRKMGYVPAKGSGRGPNWRKVESKDG